MSDVLHGAEAFRALQDRLLLGRSAGPQTTGFDEAPFRRLDRALTQASKDAPSPADLVGLIRYALRYWGCQTSTDPRLDVASRLLDGLDEDVRRFSSLEMTMMGEFVSCRARPWSPPWLPDAGDEGIDAKAASGLARRPDVSVDADPFFESALNYSTYRSPAQRTAVRAVVDAPPGSTLAIVLPTGEGKSACFYIAAKVGWFDRRASKGTVIVVTPTVALALDHESNARALGFGGGPLAYRAGEPDADLLAGHLRDGAVEICFVSPEAALGSLLPSLRAAARAGSISALVVDEAHLVDAWGGVFRPDFQFLAGLQRELVDASPDPKPRTLLLTATLTETAASILRALFVRTGEVLPIVAAPTVRPEHEYFTSRFATLDDQISYVDEAIASLPRPLIVYATAKADVRRHFDRLHARGYRRIGMMTGDSTTAERMTLLRRWSDGDCDIVVATSAFGLGVNNAEVRAVIHACLPEGLDRFYQEVGRSGRDGGAAVSLLIPTVGNLREGEDLSRRRLISVGKGYERWHQMFLTASHATSELSEDVLDLEFDIPPGVDPDRLNMRNQQNTLWNLRVVAMMSIAGLLSMRSAPRWSKANGKAKAIVSVNIEDTRHLDKEWFASRVAPYREMVVRASQGTMKMIRGHAMSEICVGQAVGQQYAVRLEVTGATPIKVRGECPGCPVTGYQGTVAHSGATHPPHPWPVQAIDEEVERLLDADGRLVVLYGDSFLPSNPRDRRPRVAALRRLLEGRIRAILVEPQLEEAVQELQRLLNDWPLFVTNGSEPGRRLTSRPTLIVKSGQISDEDFAGRRAANPTIAFGRSVDGLYSGRVIPVQLLEEYLLR